MEEEKEHTHSGGIKISEDLSEQDKNYIKEMYRNQRVSLQIPMLTDKIIVLANRIKRLNFWTSIFSISLIFLTIVLVILTWILVS